MQDSYVERIRAHAMRGTSIHEVEADLTIFEDGSLRAEYAPFDHVEQNAQIVLVGLTPGRQQARNALSAFIEQLRAGVSVPVALAVAKKTGSFSGPLRKNLTAMLDHIGVNSRLGVPTSDCLFDGKEQRAHFTSALRYPVFRNGQNYSGSPSPLKVSPLVSMIDTYLAQEASTLSSAIWIPLGSHAAAALLRLVDHGRLDRDQVLAGLPHPSGANAERVAYFLGRKSRDQLSAKTRPEPIDEGRSRLIRQVAALS
ncbi:uracil-DNA glycosylase family protein [Maricaulis salignorans]|uniref:Uracil DNA glycosylase superfamily protein n=1 Tax=Maricaulis salignorans TaxID=144026 RepID=A0A1G9UAX0_9PROT|nr:uracil-DNA glycosylase family protein [Maricaulis salignorans]SDM57110.1 Uracil DNA glycosylase superfamily protein [Maricaulis salignorans]